MKGQHDLRKRDLAILFGLAATLRLAWVALQTWRTDGLFSLPDESVYWSMAESLANGHVMQDNEGMRAGQMPLYPAFLAMFGHGLGGPLPARLAQAILGALTAPLGALLAAKFVTRRTALLAGALIAIDPFSIYFSHLILTETLFTAALVGFCLTAWPSDLQHSTPRRARRWIAGGALFAICVYIRPSCVAFVAFWTLFNMIHARRLAEPTLRFAVYAGIATLALLPWAQRNQAVIGQWTWLTQRTGISLYDGVGPQATGASDLADVKQSHQVTSRSEPQRNRYLLDASFDAMRQDPARIARLAAIKFLRTWSPRIHAPDHRSLPVQFVSVTWTLAIYACALIGIVRYRQRASEIALLLAPALYFSLIHMFFVGSVRYRLPAMPMIEILAAVGLAALAVKFGRGRYLNDGDHLISEDANPSNLDRPRR